MMRLTSMISLKCMNIVIGRTTIKPSKTGNPIKNLNELIRRGNQDEFDGLFY